MKRSPFLRITLWLAALAIGLFSLAQAMAFFKPFTLFSDLEGIVLLEGRPVEGVEVQQHYSWHWGDKRGSNVTRTDANGRYHFPVITGRSITGNLLPHEPVIDQEVSFVYQSKTFRGWFHSKHNYEDLGELDGQPLRLVCDLKDEPVGRPEIRSYGICTVQK
ncbi:DUF6795 domain-containing protein [Roseateles sp. UC29_93]|uniref:DUF6795 domain-containing protein n=1 Tax=Roseateles sp. UC29_93 TaxID=3350177 RepID=UPI00366FE08A